MEKAYAQLLAGVGLAAPYFGTAAERCPEHDTLRTQTQLRRLKLEEKASLHTPLMAGARRAVRLSASYSTDGSYEEGSYQKGWKMSASEWTPKPGGKTYLVVDAIKVYPEYRRELFGQRLDLGIAILRFLTRHYHTANLIYPTVGLAHKNRQDPINASGVYDIMDRYAIKRARQGTVLLTSKDQPFQKLAFHVLNEKESKSDRPKKGATGHSDR